MNYKALGLVLGLAAGLAAQAYAAKVAVVVSRSLLPYKAAWSGLSSKSDFELTRFNMEGNVEDARQILGRINAGNFDLVITIGSEATAAASGVNLPLVYSMVLEKPALKTAQAAGLLMDIRWEDKARHLKQLFPKMAKMGIIYSPESMSRIAPARSALSAVGIQLIPILVHSQSEFSGALATVTKDKVDSIGSVADPITLPPSATRAIIDQALAQKLPFIALNEAQVSAGALAAFSVDYFEMGVQTMELAKNLLNNKSTATAVYPSKLLFYVNTATAQKLNLADFSEAPGLQIIKR